MECEKKEIHLTILNITSWVGNNDIGEMVTNKRIGVMKLLCGKS